MAEVDNQTEWLEQEVALSREELIRHLHRALSDALFSSRAYVRPADIKPIAVTEVDTFLAFLHRPNGETVLTHGAELCRLGLGSQAMLHLGQVIRQFCLRCSVDNLNLSALEIVEAYHIALMQGFMQAQENIIFKEQERIRSALQRTLNTFTVQMRLAADIANVTSSILDLNELLHTSVELIRQRLDFYYVGLFLLDEYNRWAILRAGTGQIGREMLDQNYKVKVEDTSPIGWCLIHGEPRIVQHKGEATTVDTPTLPETYSEALLPLISRGQQVIGAMTVQSQHSKRFSEQDMTVLSIIADQVASAIQNARLFAEAQTSLEELQTIQKHYLREAWTEPIPQQLAYRYQQSTDTFALVDNTWRPTAEQAVQDKRALVVNDETASPDHSTLAIPIALRGQVIGMIDLYDASEPKTWSQDEIDLATTIASQAALSLENARLLQETQVALNESEQALAELESLYNTVRRLNEANTLQEVVAAVAAGLSIPVINRIVLAVFEKDLTGNIEAMTVSASWYRGNGPVPLPIGTRYPREIVALIQTYAISAPIFFDDIQQDERIDPAALVELIELDILAMAVLPLWVGARQSGVLLLEADETHHFTNPEIRFYTSLAQQMAVTIDNQRLLVETQAALAEVEATQRRYTLQAWEAYQAKSATDGYEWMRDGEPFLRNDLPAAVSHAVENKQVLITKPSHSNSKQGQADPDNDQTPLENCQSLIVPLTVRNEIIGILGLQETDEEREWLPEEVALIETIAKEIAQAAENLRLLDETQQRAAREKKVNEIGEKIQAAQSLEEALRIAVKEVGLSLQAPHTAVELKVK